MRISDWSSDVCSSDLRIARAAPAAAQRGGGGGKLERLGGGQIGDRGAEEKAGQHLVLRKRRNACEGDFGPQAGAGDADGGGKTLHIGFGRDVERGTGRIFAGEAELPGGRRERMAGNLIA